MTSNQDYFSEWLLASRNYIVFYRDTVADTFGEGHFISIFQFAAKGNATGNGSDFNREWFLIFY
jgi:hypothetical protein